MKFTKTLSIAEVITLEQLYQNGQSHRVRQRAHIILMSNSKFTINEISRATFLDRDTISNVINTWDSIGLVGLYDSPKSGRPLIFSKDEEKMIIDKIESDPRSLKKATAEINTETGKKASTKTIKRVLKKYKKIWKRMKKTLAGKPEDSELKKAEEDLKNLKNKAYNGEINLTYFDESGFSLTPSIAYAWQDIGKRIEIKTSRSTKINVLGFLDPFKNELTPWTFNSNINSEVVAEVFDDFANTLQKETWVVLDNASFHKSEIIEDKIKEWEDKKLFLYYLPPYSPQLNLIERVWQFMKYKWMPLDAYCSFENLRNSVDMMLSGYGDKYLITFV